MSGELACEFYVGHGVNLKGATISIKGTARIDGTMEGTVEAGHLVVGPEGKLTGDIVTQTADIEGCVDQTLSVAKLLTVKASGVIQGSVVYGELQCDQGGRLMGELSTNTSNAAKTDQAVVSITD